MDGCVEKRNPEIKEQTVATEVVRELTRLAEKCEKTSSWAEEKLTPVMKQPTPEPDCNVKGAEREYPPLFDDMRRNMNVISRSLRNIEQCLGRAEL
jgi:hypothetical protein